MILRKTKVSIDELALEELAELFVNHDSNIVPISFNYNSTKFIVEALENDYPCRELEFDRQVEFLSFRFVLDQVIYNDSIICNREKFRLHLITHLKKYPVIIAKGRFVKLNNLYYLYKNYPHVVVNKYIEDNTECYEITHELGLIVAKYQNKWLTRKTKAVKDYRRAILFIERLNSFILFDQFDLDSDIIHYIKTIYLNLIDEGIKIIC